MGLTTLPEVGTGKDLGPVKVPRPLAVTDPRRDIVTVEWNAAMQALQDVCAEVGLHDGSTAGSLVERVDALESGGGSGTPYDDDPEAPGVADPGESDEFARGDHVHPAQAMPAASDTDPEALGVASPGVSDEFARADHVHPLQSSLVDRRFTSTSTLIGADEAGEVLIAQPSGSDLSIGLESDCVQGHMSRIVRRVDTSGADPGGDIIVSGYSGTHVIEGPTTIRTPNGWLTLYCWIIDSGTHRWVSVAGPDEVSREAVAPTVQATHTASTRTIAAADAGQHIPFSGASNAVAITVPHSMFAALGPGRSFTFSGVIVNVDNAITLAGSGGLSLVYYGAKNTLDTTGDVFTVVVESATTARVYIAEAL